MGANGYRTSHYQQTEYYMDAFDEMGFLVWHNKGLELSAFRKYAPYR